MRSMSSSSSSSSKSSSCSFVHSSPFKLLSFLFADLDICVRSVDVSAGVLGVFEGGEEVGGGNGTNDDAASSSGPDGE